MLDFSTIGWIHMIFGLLALVSGTVVLLARKGTRGHRFWGYFYFFNMLGYPDRRKWTHMAYFNSTVQRTLDILLIK